MLLVTIGVSLVLRTILNDQVQLQWWGLLVASVIALLFTFPISIITATMNQTPGLNMITEYLMGIVRPGKPLTNVCFKTYGYISMGQAVSFLSDFKLGHYMKIPPRSMFLFQDLAGPKTMFGSLGNYSALNWFFLGAMIPPATTLNYNAWLVIGVIFNYYVFRYRKQWWQKYNYILSAAMDAGVAIIGVIVYFTLSNNGINLTWWGEYCDLASCRTAKGIVVDSCPVHY
ncbi:Oligopeptide transporter [Thalictrum thalictroides]|uniref:Oligopeptide transporter n=1 Tax=Thalictrum thalictroides TaxID=46969 RepID=A0A7J6VB33_THATH|nr:Oligopeptide transporter [Thalictrum thalictroides]